VFCTSFFFNNVQGSGRLYKIELHGVWCAMEDSVRIISLEKMLHEKPRLDTRATGAPDEGNEEAVCVNGF
jgi:hypothetical protein